MLLRLFFAGMLLACVVLAASADTALELRATAEQRGGTLLLGAVVNGAALGNKAATLVLPAKGRVGDTVMYGRNEIAEQIAQLHPHLLPLRWSGAQRVLVRRLGQSLAPERYLGWARDALLQRLAGRDGRFEITLAGSYRALDVPEGVCAGTTRFEREPGAGDNRIWLDIAVDRQTYVSVPVNFRVRWLRPVLVLQSAASEHLPLSAQAVALREMDVSRVNGEPLAEVAQLEGMRLRHAMAADVPLGRGDIEARPAVQQGADIDVYANVGGVVVRTRAVAQRDGIVGQRIGARVPNSNEQLWVEVTGENRAVVSNERR